MTEPLNAPQNQTRHIVALVAGVAVLLAFFALPGGFGGYSVMIVIGIVAVLISNTVAYESLSPSDSI